MIAVALVSSALAGPPSVTLEVVDEAGDPVGSALLIEQAEQEKHMVNHESGRWMTSRFFLPDGTEVGVEKGGSYTFWVSAPGYSSTNVTVDQKGKKSKTTVTLNAWPIVVDNTADPSALPAVQAYDAWKSSYLAYLKAPSDAGAEEARKLAAAAVEPIQVWLGRVDEDTRPMAWTACMHVSTPKVCGEL